MSSNLSATYLDAFNARNANAVEVAQSFVYSNHFELVAGDWHAIIVGPRGSGKTTLLKMLQVNALRCWEGEDGDRLAPSIRNVGVYVPADVAWSVQLDSLANGKPISETVSFLIRTAAFTTHIFQAVLKALEERLTVPCDAPRGNLFNLQLSQESEAALVNQISDLWLLKPKLPTLSSLRVALVERHSEIAKEASRLRMGHVADDSKSIIERNAFFELDPLQSVAAAVAEVNVVAEEPKRRWALLFDELEIIPTQLQRIVFRLLRSTDQSLLFKIAISPHTPEWAAVLAEEHGPREEHDFKEVPLWYTGRASMYEFGRRLFDKQIEQAGLPVSTAADFLGHSHIFALDDSKSGKSPGQNERWSEVFMSLAAKDKTFAAFLKKKRIDVESVGISDGPLIRKVKPIVALRDFYTKKVDGEVRKAGRKILPYTGVEALVAATEGNPRWIIALAKSLVARARDRGKYPISDAIQSEELTKVSKRFVAMLRTAPVGDIRGLPPRTGVWDFLEKIGKSAEHDVLYAPFKEEPACSWVVGQDCADWQESLLRLALNFGGVVYLPGPECSAALDSLKGKKFRLSFLLAPMFKLPLRSTKAIMLNRLLADSQRDMFIAEERNGAD